MTNLPCLVPVMPFKLIIMTVVAKFAELYRAAVANRDTVTIDILEANNKRCGLSEDNANLINNADGN